MISAFVARGGDGVCVPVRHGRRGNPVLWGARFFAEMAALSGDAGAKELLRRHADQVTEVEMETGAIFADIDAPADLDRLNDELRSAEIDADGVGGRSRVRRRWEGRGIAHGGERHLVEL